MLTRVNGVWPHREFQLDIITVFVYAGKYIFLVLELMFCACKKLKKTKTGTNNNTDKMISFSLVCDINCHDINPYPARTESDYHLPPV